jgi:hypothetical protein
MGGGDGTVIVRDAMKQALTNPIVHGALPQSHQDSIDPFINTDSGTWTADQQKHAFKAFEWAEKHC